MLPSILPISFFLFYLVLGCLSAYIAIKKNRNPIGWFFAGMLFGIIGIVLLLILPNLSKNNSQNHKTPTTGGNLNILEEIQNSETLEKKSSDSSDLTQAPIDTEKWFYLSKDKQNIGPLSLENLLIFLRDKERHAQENISPEEIWVWKKGMANWERVKNVTELREALEILL
ncbi:DUF4339 domain-containing protein [Chlamydia sp. 17-3921]|uniref:DUF4339 domain-containing protein n=1 Tax=Chlamydia sp. 17-3921 TaxID=2675798 RepID=UPI0019192E7F|nr:DUF4339 domain-containing protein [Chlamydia sp. 17-3921]